MIARILPRLLILILVGIVVYLVLSFVGKRDEYGYIGPDTSSDSYRWLMSWLDSWSSYMSWDFSDLGQTQEYFRWAIDRNQDTVLWSALSSNMTKVKERSQLETIQVCVSAVRSIGGTRDDIDRSYDEMFALLQDQISLVPTVILSIKNLSTVRCVKNYLDHIRKTSMLLVQTSQSWGQEKQSYADEINRYPRKLDNCDKILLIQAQSQKLQQELATMKFTYNQYRETLNDPSRHAQLCNEHYSDTLSSSISKITMPKLKQLGTNIDDAITLIKSNMQDVASWTFVPVRIK